MFDIGDVTAKAVVNAPIETINLGDWMFTITAEEYAACASGHQSAAQGKLASGKRFSVNLEVVGGTFMVQHYVEKVAKRDHVIGFSPSTTFFLGDTDCVFAQITWELKVEKLDEKRCELICRVFAESDNEDFVAGLKKAVEENPDEKSALHLHIEEESPMFAKDIERKALAGVWRSQ
jgi:hypothetical protein